ncbi:MAG: hypothetical protein ACQETH_15875 [Candidatus Rifleibacteriota bacterium]
MVKILYLTERNITRAFGNQLIKIDRKWQGWRSNLIVIGHRILVVER